MRCPYCGTENGEGAESCRNCGEELSQARARWGGPGSEPTANTPQQISAAHDEWDPAKRFAGARPTSAFVPPARYPTHLSWIITIICLGIPATALNIALFSRGAEYPNNLGVAVVVIMLCCLPLSVVSLILTRLMKSSQRAGNDAGTYRYSRTIGLLCWISLLAALALYVIFFLQLMSNVSEVASY